MWIYVLGICGGPIVVLAGLLAWRDHGTRRRGGKTGYLTSNALDAHRGGPDQPVVRGYQVFGTGGEVLPPFDP